METVETPQGTSGQAAPAPTGQPTNAAPTNNATPATQQPSGQAEPKATNLEGADNWEYDGNPNAVPKQFQKFAKGIQQHFTKKSMSEAELRRKGQEYDQFTQSDEFKNYQAWRSQQNGQPTAQPQAQPQNPALISQQEWEEAQLDPSGQKAQALMDRVADAKVQAAIRQYGGQINQIRQEQNLTKFNTALSDYADANPDIMDLHQMGLMKPLLEEEYASGKHRTHESAIAAAHKRASDAHQQVKARLMEEQQKLVEAKRDATVTQGTGTGEANVVIVDKNNAFETAFENAVAGKKIKNKLK